MHLKKALHGAGEGFLAASVVESGVQENALKCLNPPWRACFRTLFLTIEKQFSTRLVKHFLATFVPYYGVSEFSF